MSLSKLSILLSPYILFFIYSSYVVFNLSENKGYVMLCYVMLCYSYSADNFATRALTLYFQSLQMMCKFSFS